jgi:site-specific DNA-methyltransferase (adenine-specific)
MITNEDNMQLMARYEDNHFDLAIVDPPYGIGMGGGKFGNSKTDFKQFAGSDECIPDVDYFKEMMRVSKNYIVWGGNYMTEFLPPKSCFIVWDKVQPEQFTMAMAELAITSFNSPAKIFKQRIVGANKNGKIHPTQKPIKLYEWILMNYAKEGDKILDTHLGSGSIAIACHNLGFDLTACELDKDYYEAAMKRIQQHKQQTRMF